HAAGRMPLRPPLSSWGQRILVRHKKEFFMTRWFISALLAVCCMAVVAAADKRPFTPKLLTGKIKRIDVEKGSLVLIVRVDEDETKEIDAKILETTRFTFLEKTGKKQLTGKAGLESEQLKVGTYVEIVKDPEGQVQEVRTRLGQKQLDRARPRD